MQPAGEGDDVAVDDAQWADELSLRALSFATRRLAADPVLCLVATRSDGLARLPPGLLRVATERGTRLELAGLDAGEVAALAELAGAGPLPGRAAERLREHTGGIPLHVRELLHDLPGQMLRRPGVELPAPRSLQTLVVSRLAACSVDTEALVVAAAVLGADCELADAAALAGLADPLPALQEAIDQRLLAGAGAPAEQQIRGAWAMLAAEAATGHAPTDEAAAKTACELAQLLIGQHRLADAASWAHRAADAAASEFTRACSHAVQGFSLGIAGQAPRARALLEAELAQCTDDTARSLLHAGLGGALLFADDLTGAAAHLTAATTRGRARLPMTHMLQAWLLQVNLHYRAGYWDQAAAVGERLITTIDDLDQGWLLGPAHLAVVYAAAGRGHWHAAVSHADAAAAQPGAGVLALADARTAIAVARDDVPAILAAAADVVADPGLVHRLEPSRLSCWPAYAPGRPAPGRRPRYRHGPRAVRRAARPALP